jgi:hypothetical protein
MLLFKEPVYHPLFHSRFHHPDLLFLQLEFQTPRLRVRKTTRRLAARTAKLWRAGVPWVTTPGALVRRNALQTTRSLTAPTTDAKETTREHVLLFVTYIRFCLLVKLLT